MSTDDSKFSHSVLKHGDRLGPDVYTSNQFEDGLNWITIHIQIPVGPFFFLQLNGPTLWLSLYRFIINPFTH
jgi:hypothetical protein